MSTTAQDVQRLEEQLAAVRKQKAQAASEADRKRNLQQRAERVRRALAEEGVSVQASAVPSRSAESVPRGCRQRHPLRRRLSRGPISPHGKRRRAGLRRPHVGRPSCVLAFPRRPAHRLLSHRARTKQPRARRASRTSRKPSAGTAGRRRLRIPSVRRSTTSTSGPNGPSRSPSAKPPTRPRRASENASRSWPIRSARPPGRPGGDSR